MTSPPAAADRPRWSRFHGQTVSIDELGPVAVQWWATEGEKVWRAIPGDRLIEVTDRRFDIVPMSAFAVFERMLAEFYEGEVLTRVRALGSFEAEELLSRTPAEMALGLAALSVRVNEEQRLLWGSPETQPGLIRLGEWTAELALANDAIRRHLGEARKVVGLGDLQLVGRGYRCFGGAGKR